MGATSELQRSRDPNARLQQLLERIALVTRAADGGATLLYSLGRITSSSRWLDDEFTVEITGNDVDSTLEIWVERGNARERIVEPTKYAVPVDELIAALEADPTLVGSLRIAVEPRKLSLAPRLSGVHVRPPRDDD